jgi:hypothetical protein
MIFDLSLKSSFGARQAHFKNQKSKIKNRKSIRQRRAYQKLHGAAAGIRGSDCRAAVMSAGSSNGSAAGISSRLAPWAIRSRTLTAPNGANLRVRLKAGLHTSPSTLIPKETPTGFGIKAQGWSVATTLGVGQ